MIVERNSDVSTFVSCKHVCVVCGSVNLTQRLCRCGWRLHQYWWEDEEKFDEEKKQQQQSDLLMNIRLPFAPVCLPCVPVRYLSL
jgi:hypothetical protein